MKRYFLVPIILLLGSVILSGAYFSVRYLKEKAATFEYEEQRKTLDIDKYNEYGLLDEKVLTEEALYENDVFIIFSDRVLFKYSLNSENEYYFANRTNYLNDVLGSDVHVSVMPIPTRIQYESVELSENYQKQFNECIDYLKEVLNEDIGLIDCSGLIDENGGRNLFYRTNDMWNMTGAYYGYYAFCNETGTVSFSIDYFPEKQISHFRGGLISRALPTIPEDHEIIPVLSAIEDDPFFFRLAKDSKNYELVKDSESEKIFKRPLISNTVTGNSSVVGSSVEYAIIPGNGEGNVLLITDDNGKLIAPYLAENFENVIVFDISKYDGKNMQQILAPYKISEVLVTESVERIGVKNQSIFYNSLTRE